MEGEVKNYVPVTDAMLRNPDPSDWLMIRHDYKATYHSPLNQITAQNVNDLRLMWSWAMQDRASNGNQPAAAPEMAQRCTPTPLWRWMLIRES